MSAEHHDDPKRAARRRPSRQETRRAAGYQTPDDSTAYTQGSVDTSIPDAIQGIVEGAYGMFSKRIALARYRLVHDGQDLLDQGTERAEAALASSKEIGISIALLIACASLLLVGVFTLELGVVLLVYALAQPVWAGPVAILSFALLDLAIGGGLGMMARKRLKEGKKLLDQAKQPPSLRSWDDGGHLLPEDRSVPAIAALPASTQNATPKEDHHAKQSVAASATVKH